MNDDVKPCRCSAYPEQHVHVRTQGELDEARQTFPHIPIIHAGYECECMSCIENRRPR
jgi:hypothetical protein